MFVAVAEEGHFGHAATRLGMTQPPVSAGLRRLETELGVTLLRRTSHGTDLTTAGRELLPRARLLVDDAERFRGESRRLAAQVDSVRWAVVAQVSPSLAAACARRLQQAGVFARMSRGRATTLVSEIRSNAIDLALVDCPCVIGELESSSVIGVGRSVVVPENHPVARSPRPTVRQLADLVLCHPLRAANPPAHDQLMTGLGSHGLSPDVLAISDEGEAISAVAAGHAWMLTCSPAAFAHIDAVRCVSLAPESMMLRLRVVHRPETPAAVVDALTAALWKESRKTS